MPRHPPDPETLRRCLEGDQQAWRALVDHYAGFVYTLARRCGLDETACDDVAQVVFAILVRKLGTVQSESSLAAWLATTTRREAWRLKRRLSRLRNREMPLETEMPDAQVFAQDFELRQMVHWGLDRLDPRCRELLRRLYLSGEPQDYETVAEALGLAVGSVGPIRQRCLAKLADHLRGLPGFSDS